MNGHRTTMVGFAACAIAVGCGSCGGGDDVSAPTTTTAAPVPTITTAVARSATTAAPVPTITTAPPVPSVATTGAACMAAPGRSDITLTGGGYLHPVRIYVPSTAPGFAVLPTVLSWHGLGETTDDYTAYNGLEQLAEREGFVVVHPTGALSPGLPVLETGLGWELVDALDTPDRDDVAFASALIDELEAVWCADPSRIYSIGMSNGSMFTSTLVCRLSDRLAAAASVAGVYHSDTCAPSEPVPYLAFHGTDDSTVPYETGGATLVPELRDSILALGAFDAFAAFANGAGCQHQPVPVVLTDSVTRYDYLGCHGETPMSFYEMKGLDHVWPGVVGEPMAGDFDATAEAWKFFEQHSRLNP
jgi:polyhydroxybutyrate depolymerase